VLTMKACRNCSFSGHYYTGCQRQGVRLQYAHELPGRLSPRSNARWWQERIAEMRQKQGDRCAICQRKVKLVVDHNHGCCSNKRGCVRCVRGLLCNQCNSGIGMLGDSATRVAAAARYLEERPLPDLQTYRAESRRRADAGDNYDPTRPAWRYPQTVVSENDKAEALGRLTKSPGGLQPT
jgi:Recombination endonuclease VII